MNKNKLIILAFFFLFISCKKHITETQNCDNDNLVNTITQRNFEMGFSTWSFGPDLSDIEETYRFIQANADVYSEQIDHKIPWNALINNTPFPAEFVNNIDYRVSKKINNSKLLLSVSLLNIERDDLLEDYDGTIPNYIALNDTIIEQAYYRYLEYLILRFNPDYLITAMEVNELKMHSETKWTAYKLLMNNIRSRLKNAYPNLQFSESITLHNWFTPDVNNPNDFTLDITNYVNQNLDFVAISYYPFFENQHTKTEFQTGFDFLHAHTSLPIAFVETSMIAENLVIPNYNINIPSNVCEQKDYLESLLVNAYNHNYKFIIWWTYRDFDELWRTFPPELRDIGKIWRDTGLIDENEQERPAFAIWKQVLHK